MRRAALLCLLTGCVGAPKSAAVTAAPAAAAEAARPAFPKTDARRAELLGRLGGPDALSEILRPDDQDGPLLAGAALEAYAEGSELKAVLLAQAALGADPGNGTRRRLLHALALATGIPFDPDGVLPAAALVHHELSRAEKAFFERAFGAAAQHCRRALLLAPDDAAAWTRLGSSYYAVGDEERARQAYAKARALKPADETLARFMAERGWPQ